MTLFAGLFVYCDLRQNIFLPDAPGQRSHIRRPLERAGDSLQLFRDQVQCWIAQTNSFPFVLSLIVLKQKIRLDQCLQRKNFVDSNKTCLHYEVVTDNDMVLITECSMIETNTVVFIKKQIIIQRSRVQTNFPNNLKFKATSLSL